MSLIKITCSIHLTEALCGVCDKSKGTEKTEKAEKAGKAKRRAREKDGGRKDKQRRGQKKRRREDNSLTARLQRPASLLQAPLSCSTAFSLFPRQLRITKCGIGQLMKNSCIGEATSEFQVEIQLATSATVTATATVTVAMSIGFLQSIR